MSGAILEQQGGGGEQGFTIVEVMIAMVIMLVGVLGTLVLIEGSMASTSRTTAREQGTNLARDLVERSRQADYASVTMDLAPATLRATLPASDNASALTGSTFSVKRRNVVYTVTIFACSIDDPTDGAGVGNATFCALPAGTTPTEPPAAAAAVNVLGVGVALGGSLLSTVCHAVGTDSALLNQLTSAVSTVTPISVCPAGTGTTGGVPYDSDPDDLRRVRIDVTWSSGGSPGEVSQTTLLTNPRSR